MFTRLFPSADFGGKERRLIFDGPQNTPEQSFAEQVEANLPNLENNLDSPLKAQAVAEIKVALAEKDANVMKKGIENALANIARTEFALLKEKHQGDEKAAAAELQADFRTIGLVNVEKRDDGTFYVSVIVPGAQNAPPNFNAPQQAPGAPGAPSAKPANALEAPKDIPEEKLEGLSDEQKEVLREGYKLLPPEAQKVMIELLKSQEAVQGMLSLAPKIAADPSMIPKLMKVSEAEYQNPDTIKDPALQNLVKGLSAGDRRLLSALFRVLQKSPDARNQLTDSQRKKIMDDGRAEFDRFAQIQNPTAIQKEQYLAKLQMKGCDVSDEKGALTGNIKALEGTAWERTFNMILGFVRYFGSAITLVKEKFSGKKTDTTDKPSDQPEAPDAKNQRVGTELLQKNGAKIVNGIHAFSDDKGILENDNFPIYKFENGKWMARLEKGNDPWKETGQMKFTGPENLAGTLEPVFKKWEDVTKGLADANGEAEKAKATQKPAGEAPEKKLMNDEVIAASKINEEKTAAIFKNVLESGGKDGWVRITIDGKQDRFEYKIGLEEDQPSLQRQLPNVERSKWQYNAADKRWKPLA